MKLLLIDGLNLLRRVYEANPSPDTLAKAAGAVKAAASSVKRALKEHAPTHAFCGMDTALPNWRHGLYARYREGRKPMPQELREAIPFFLENLDSLDVCHDSLAGYEAEDALNAYARLWSLETKGAPCVVLSTDKDVLQLLCYDGVLVRDHFEEVWRDEAYVGKKYHGLSARHVGDMLALMGDSVDGVPGVTKVGSKTAAALLLEHGDLEGVLNAAASIKGKLGERLREEADIARLSRALVTLKHEGEGLMKFSLSELALQLPAAS
jgi:protein Xni